MATSTSSSEQSEESTPVSEQSEESTPVSEQSEGRITTHATAPEKTVFVESGNHDAWIATDLVVELER